MKIATRGSELALTQARMLQKTLKSKKIETDLHIVQTKGDKDQRPFQKIQGDGFFTKEIERELLNGHADLAIHSAKDLPSMVHHSLPWVAYSEREIAYDIVIFKKNELTWDKNDHYFKSKKSHIVVGTSSPRRAQQLQQFFPNAQAQPLRGNVPTRISQVANAKYDAIILAEAGVKRLGLLDNLKGQGLDWLRVPWTPAPCQGILAVQLAPHQKEKAELIQNFELTQIAFAEKMFLAFLGGGCHLPLGAHIQKQKDRFHLDFFWSDTRSSVEFHIDHNDLAELVRTGFRQITESPHNSSQVWLTHSLQNHRKVYELLSESGLTPVSWPLQEIRPSFDLQTLTQIEINNNETVVFGSAFGAHLFFTEVAPFVNAQQINYWAIGAATAQRLKDHGVKDIHLPSDAHSDSLAQALVAKGIKSVVFAGTKKSEAIKKLKSAGISVRLIELYTSLPSSSVLTQKIPPIANHSHIVLASPSSARIFALQVQRHPELKKLQVWSMGPTTSETLSQLGLDHTTTKTSGSWSQLIKDIIKAKGSI